MRKILFSLGLLALSSIGAQAQNYTATAGSGLTFGAALTGGVLYPRHLWCDPTTPTQCVVVDASGRITLAPNQSINNAQINGVTPLMGNGVTGTGSQRVTIASDNTPFTVNAAQSTAANLNATVVPSAAATWGIGTSTQNSATVSNGQLGLAQFNTTPTTITSGNMSPLQMDNAGNLLVNIKAGAAAGGTSSNFGSAFPTPGTAAGFTDGTNMTAGRVGAVSNVAAATGFLDSLGVCQYLATPPTITDTRFNQVQCDVNGNQKVTVVNTLAAVGNNADDVAAGAGAASPVVAYNYIWDPVGGNWDRQRASTAVLNPCETVAQSYAPISITSATTTQIVAASASNKTYICGLIIVTGAANNVAIVEGTGGTCGTGTAGVIGGTTAANGSNFSANGGLVLQAGKTAHAQTAGTNVGLCVITSSTGPYSGGIKYVQAP